MEELQEKIQRILKDKDFLHGTYEVYDNTTSILHIHGQDVLLDTEDLKKLEGKKLGITNGYATFHEYVYNNLDKSSTLILTRIHQYIIECPKGFIIHHINGNKLDNRKENLLICTQGEHRKLHWIEQH